MASKIIPSAPSEAEWVTTVELDEKDYRVRYRWRERINGGSWYVDLEAADGTPLVQGRRLTPNEDLLASLVGEDLPPGRFIVLGRDPYRRHDLGGDLQLLYIPTSEVPSATSSVTYTVGNAVVS